MVRTGEKQVLLILSTFALFHVGLSLECWQTTDTREWSLSAVCWDKSLQSFDKCQWYVAYDKKVTRVYPSQTSTSFDKPSNCFGKLPLPLSPGDYTYHLFLADKNYQQAFTVRIDDPGELAVKNCKHEVSEGDNVTCVCSTQREGSPPPVISWTGQTTSPILHLYNVTGEHNKTYTCEMIWGNQTKTVYHSFLVRDNDLVKGVKDVSHATTGNVTAVSTHSHRTEGSTMSTAITTIYRTTFEDSLDDAEDDAQTPSNHTPVDQPQD